MKVNEQDVAQILKTIKQYITEEQLWQTWKTIERRMKTAQNEEGAHHRLDRQLLGELGARHVPHVTFSPESGGIMNTMRESPERKKHGRTRFQR